MKFLVIYDKETEREFFLNFSFITNIYPSERNKKSVSIRINMSNGCSCILYYDASPITHNSTDMQRSLESIRDAIILEHAHCRIECDRIYFE